MPLWPMTYEETRENVQPVSQIYNEVSLSLFNIANVMYRDSYWYGSVEELAEIDPALAKGISKSGTKWVAALLLESSRELGFLILSFDYIPQDQKLIGKNIRRVGVSIASKLDYVPEKR